MAHTMTGSPTGVDAMSTREWIEILSIATGAVVAVGGIVAGIMWLAKGYIKYMKELHELRQEIERLRREAEQAKRFELERDRAIQEKGEAEEELKKAHDETKKARQVAKRNYDIATTNFEIARRIRQHVIAAKEEEQKARTEQKKAEKATQDVAENAQRAEKHLRDEIGKTASELQVANDLLEKHKKTVEGYETRNKSVLQHKGRIWLTAPLTKPPEFVPLKKRNTRIISILNLKGGVGKTTITANLGGYLAACREKWVLLLDLDHQRSLTQLLLSSEKRKDAAIANRTIQDFFHSTRGGENLRAVAEQLQGDRLSRCWIVGNTDADIGYGTRENLDDLEMKFLGRWLVHPEEMDIRYLLRPALHSEVIQERFDYVLIDCPPRLTTACINALAASDFIIIPSEAEKVSARSVPHLLRRIRELRDAQIIPDLKVLGILANMVSASIGDPKSMEAKVLLETAGLAHRVWGSQVRVLKSKIRESGYYASCQREIESKVRLPAVCVDEISSQYKNLVSEIEGYINESLDVVAVS
jgi:cellulose biosynthesis protein BcsQ